MKRFEIRCSLITVAVLAIVPLFLISISAAQDEGGPASRRGQVASNKPTPRTADGHPNFNGFYNNGEGYSLTRSDDGSVLYEHTGADNPQLELPSAAVMANPAPYKPEYLEKFKALQKTAYGHTTAMDPMMDCIPLGIPRGGAGGIGAMQIVQTSEVIAILYERNPGNLHRLIYLDGRPHPKDIDTSAMGHSVGHWEGDTLVVDVVGLDDTTWLGAVDVATIHSDKEHVTERWTRNGDAITYEATVEDPVVFTRPWTITPQHVNLAPPDDEMLPAIPCAALDKPHLIQETEKDKFLCGWCVPERAYGLDSDELTTGQVAPPSRQEGLKTKVDATQ